MRALGWRLCAFPAVGARAVTLRPADEKSCSAHVPHALIRIRVGLVVDELVNDMCCVLLFWLEV